MRASSAFGPAWPALVAVLIGLGIVWIGKDRTTATRGSSIEAQPRACIGPISSTARSQNGWHPSTLALAIASMPEPGRVAGTIADQIARIEERAHPLALHLDEADPDDGSRLQAELWPRMTAAQAWLRPSLEREGLALVPCDSPAARYRLWKTESDELPLAPPRMRQAAWATASAALLRSEAPRDLAARLRSRSVEAGSTIALVITHRVSVPELLDLAARARRMTQNAARSGRRAPELLAPIAAAATTADFPRALDASDLAVVPRLGALARLEDFVAEIEAELGPRDAFDQRPTTFTEGDSLPPERVIAASPTRHSTDREQRR